MYINTLFSQLFLHVHTDKCTLYINSRVNSATFKFVRVCGKVLRSGLHNEVSSAVPCHRQLRFRRTYKRGLGTNAAT